MLTLNGTASGCRISVMQIARVSEFKFSSSSTPVQADSIFFMAVSLRPTKKAAASKKTDSKPVKKTSKVAKETTEKALSTLPAVTPGGAVVYVGRVPHGFYEEEMREYFGQFGEITRLRLSRNRTTGASKHYAFIEFRHANVAEIVVETMHNYLLFNQLLQCRLVPNEKVHADCFKGANRKFKVVPWNLINRKKHNAEKTSEELEKLKERLAERKKTLESKLQQSGIQYDLSEIVH